MKRLRVDTDDKVDIYEVQIQTSYTGTLEPIYGDFEDYIESMKNLLKEGKMDKLFVDNDYEKLRVFCTKDIEVIKKDFDYLDLEPEEVENWAEKIQKITNMRSESKIESILGDLCMVQRDVKRTREVNTKQRKLRLKQVVRKICEVYNFLRIYSKEISVDGKRNYIISTPYDLYKHSIQKEIGTLYLHENIPLNARCRLFLDIDASVDFENLASLRKIYNEKQILAKSKSFFYKLGIAINRIVISMVTYMLSKFQVQSKGNVEILWQVSDASDLKKISKHVIVKVQNDAYLFQKKKDIEIFIWDWLQFINHDERKKNSENDKKWGDSVVDDSISILCGKIIRNIDFSNYNGEREFRMLNSEKMESGRKLCCESRNVISVENVDVGYITRNLNPLKDEFDVDKKIKIESKLFLKFNVNVLQKWFDRRSDVFLDDISENEYSTDKIWEILKENNCDDNYDSEMKSIFGNECEKFSLLDILSDGIKRPSIDVADVIMDDEIPSVCSNDRVNTYVLFMDNLVIPPPEKKTEYLMCYKNISTYEREIRKKKRMLGVGKNVDSGKPMNTKSNFDIYVFWDYLTNFENNLLKTNVIIEEKGIEGCKMLIKNLEILKKAIVSIESEENQVTNEDFHVTLEEYRNIKNWLLAKALVLGKTIAENVDHQYDLPDLTHITISFINGYHYMYFSDDRGYKRCRIKNMVKNGGIYNPDDDVCHESNNVYFTLCLQNKMYSQKCHDEECKKLLNYKKQYSEKNGFDDMDELDKNLSNYNYKKKLPNELIEDMNNFLIIIECINFINSDPILKINQ